MPGSDIPEILVEERGPVLWLTINRADKANALTVAMSEALESALRQAPSREGITAVVLTGAGERIFCAGVDLREKAPDGDGAAQRARRSAATARVQDTILDMGLPVVVALNGLAVGAGAMVALIADHCLAASQAAISLPEIDIAIPTFSGASILEARAGSALARDLIQTGRRLSAAEAQERGLCRVVAQEELADAAQSLAEALGAKDRATFAEVKGWLNRGLRTAMADAREEHRAHRARLQSREETAHG